MPLFRAIHFTRISYKRQKTEQRLQSANLREFVKKIFEAPVSGIRQKRSKSFSRNNAKIFVESPKEVKESPG